MASLKNQKERILLPCGCRALVGWGARFRHPRGKTASRRVAGRRAAPYLRAPRLTSFLPIQPLKWVPLITVVWSSVLNAEGLTGGSTRAKSLFFRGIFSMARKYSRTNPSPRIRRLLRALWGLSNCITTGKFNIFFCRAGSRELVSYEIRRHLDLPGEYLTSGTLISSKLYMVFF